MCQHPPPPPYPIKIFENVQVQSDQAGGLHSIQLRSQTQVHRGGTVSTFFQSFLHHTEFREDFFLSSIFKIKKKFSHRHAVFKDIL